MNMGHFISFDLIVEDLWIAHRIEFLALTHTMRYFLVDICFNLCQQTGIILAVFFQKPGKLHVFYLNSLAFVPF